MQEEDLVDVIKKLAEHFQQENESVVRAKILSLFGDIGKEPGADVQACMKMTYATFVRSYDFLLPHIMQLEECFNNQFTSPPPISIKEA